MAEAIKIKNLSPREETLLIELMDLRRERIRLDRRIREVLMLQRIERGLSPRPLKSGDPSSPEFPCHCLRCDYAWYPADPTRAPKCCSRCGTTNWMLPPTDTSRRPGDAPAESWGRRKDPRIRLRERAIREKEAEKKAAEAIPAWHGPDNPVPPVVYPWDKPLNLPPPGGPEPHNVTLPPPPSIAALLPRPPDPVAVSLSARLAAAREQDLSPEQPERQASMARAPVAPPIIEETVSPIEETPETEETIEETPAETVETLPDDVPPESIGVPVTDAEREELARAQEAAWPTTRSED